MPFFQRFAAGRLTPISRAAADMDQLCASSSMNRPELTTSAYDPVPSEHNETTYENRFPMVLVENHRAAMASFSTVADVEG